jgi:hypothetical protein
MSTKEKPNFYITKQKAKLSFNPEIERLTIAESILKNQHTKNQDELDELAIYLVSEGYGDTNVLEEILNHRTKECD